MKQAIITTLGCLFAFYPKAQVTVQNTGTLYVGTSSDILYINGPFTNALGAAFTNNGQLYVLGNLTNNEVGMATGTGRLLLAGTAAQTLNGNQAFKTFNLTTNNSAGILLNNNLDVNGAHTFTSGIITTSVTPNYLVYEATATYSGDGNGAHVNGWVKRFGSSNFAFPTGNGTYERPVSITSLSVTGEFNAHHNMTTPNTGSVQSPIVRVDPFEYWTINKISGGTAQIAMNWDRSKIDFPGYLLADIRAVYNNAGTWTNIGGTATGNPSTAGSITSNAVSIFGNFAIGSVSVALPLTFLGIWGLGGETYNLVQWKTAEESGIDHFEVERSTNGFNFNSIGQVAPNNTLPTHTYEFYDRQLPTATCWYRVRNADIDGNGKYSTTVKILPGNRNGAIKVINNPVTGGIIYVAAAEQFRGAYTYQLMNTAAQTIQKGTLQITQSGIVPVALNSQIVPGLYTLRIFNSDNQFLNRIIIK
ncbi:MAG: hypothetical protein ACJ751_11605 [Niastella sp.]|uniref:hypothetical protein n=1 Tax=Niastella sp. TaxID=1869183 RepID=UPI00389B02EE